MSRGFTVRCRQAQVEDEEEVVIKLEEVIKQEEDDDVDLDVDLPTIDDIINGRS
jgi:hypothetical protein